jgi:hypothetical protein
MRLTNQPRLPPGRCGSVALRQSAPGARRHKAQASQRHQHNHTDRSGSNGSSGSLVNCRLGCTPSVTSFRIGIGSVSQMAGWYGAMKSSGVSAGR